MENKNTAAESTEDLLNDIFNELLSDVEDADGIYSAAILMKWTARFPHLTDEIQAFYTFSAWTDSLPEVEISDAEWERLEEKYEAKIDKCFAKIQEDLHAKMKG